jgi:hypothetical protein
MTVSELHRGDGLIGHFEHHLGPIQEGWSTAGSDEVQIVRFSESPVEKASTFSTLGLSRVPLAGPRGAPFHQELIFACQDRFASWGLPAVLQQLGDEAVASGKAYLRGQCVGPRGRLFPEAALTAVYFALPVYWPESFAVFQPTGGRGIQISWTIPVFESEASKIREHGWEAFETLLLEEDPDLLDLSRTPI